MFILAESPDLLPRSSSRDDIARNIEAARIVGWNIILMPPDFSECETAENALWQAREQREPTPAIWLGYIPDVERYEAIYQEARAKNLMLPNTPAQHQTAQEFDRAYPFLEDLTPKSVIVNSVEEAVSRVPEVGFPVFIKGAVQSRKGRGWKACVADNEQELAVRVGELLQLEHRSRGRVVLREVVKLRHTRTHGDFPLGREYRVVVLNGQIVALGYYWPGEDEQKALNRTEKVAVENLAREAARRVPVPYLAVDIGQKEDGEWVVIEIGDAQFAGLSEINPLELWSRLKETMATFRDWE